ncbi:glutamine amidotransferase [Aequitasia blattaphilus]|uniref:Imidazole glycerol phosphate synthase subunit HisH n=1 Tax=Aequitasia blattaphilus TaxID=2949332 RepID=A0ABT1E9V0_9FIRM|nr:imidazole glycerol phosphate synthase subunit HisH [Aequitasia blattaphilus]MCP1102613.1 imidazole glycerol phosphate synthase subunit HisH [Aequitasia blattaphilus]MCR8615253.1 imidazole glycerol phosphate synthase subunit HisH [Aequitasia blattaphilus]
MIAIIDYDAGNIKSVVKAFEYLGADIKVTREKEEILRADKVVLPGVGAFGDAKAKLVEYDLVETILEVIQRKTPFFGICLGMQLLFERSEEAEGVEGLGILKGDICKFPSSRELKIPHMGWNSLDFPRRGNLFSGVDENSFVYFVHSYYLKAKDESVVTATADYGVTIHASVEKDNVFGCQFHPEKSSKTGLKILKNFIEL